jgi:hypothetical protein
MKTKPLSLVLFCVLLAFHLASSAQSMADFDLFPLPKMNAISSIVIAPGTTTAAIGTGQGPLYLWDFSTQEFIKTIDIDGFYAGPRLSFTNDGNYLLMQQQFYVDFAPNKDRPIRIDILDINTGKVIFSRGSVFAAQLLSDSKSVVVLEGDHVSTYDFVNGNKTISHKVEGAMFSMAINPDRTIIAISHKTSEADLDALPFYKNDKKARKHALKRTHVVVLYDYNTFEKIATAGEIFDLVFKAEFTADGKELLVYTIPHSKAGVRPGGLLGFITKIDGKTGEIKRASFMSRLPEPDFKLKNDQAILGVSSIESRTRGIPQVILYDYNTGSLINKFDLETRLLETMTDGRLSFEFLPNSNNLLIGYGDKIALWKLK